jgi:hypothetical protein
MAGDIKQKFGASAQALTITLTSLASAAGRESTAVDNSSNLYSDVLIMVKSRTGASGTSSTGYMTVYAYGSVDGGSTYSGNATGSDAGITPQNMNSIGRIDMVANSTNYRSPIMSLAAAFGGVMPERWGVVIVNNTGATIDGTGSNHAVLWQGVYAQYT